MSEQTFDEIWQTADDRHPRSPLLILRADCGKVTSWIYEEFGVVVARADRRSSLPPTGDAVHVVLRSCPAFLALWLAFARLSACFVPVGPGFGGTRDIESQVRRSKVAVDARLPIRLPRTWSHESGAAAVLSLMTAHNALSATGRLAAGESVEVTAARSRAGQATVRIAREFGAGRVLAVVRSMGDETPLRDLGAEAIVETGSLGFAETVLAATDGSGC